MMETKDKKITNRKLNYTKRGSNNGNISLEQVIKTKQEEKKNKENKTR